MKGKKFIAIISIVCILAVMLCVPAFATVTESNGDGFALYNGVKLLNIDTVWNDKVSYPYAIVTGSAEYYAVMVLLQQPVSYDGSHYVSNIGTSVSMYLYTLNQEVASVLNIKVGVWTFDSSGVLDSTYVIDIVDWTSHDILNTTDNSIYLAASTPISLDGYNLIEWDGDPTGLTSVGLAHYLLAPYEYAYNALAVWKSSMLRVQTDYYTESPMWAVRASGIGDIAPDGTPIVVASDGVYDGTELNGIAAGYASNDSYVSLIAYRTTEAPPGEGGDTPDDPQPPFGATEI